MKISAYSLAILLSLSLGSINAGTMFTQLTQDEWSLVEKLSLTKETETLLEMQKKYPNSKMIEFIEKEYMNKFLTAYFNNKQNTKKQYSPLCIWFVKSAFSGWGLHQMVTNIKSSM